MKLRCKDAEILLCRHLTQELGPKDAKELATHLQECVACRQTLTFHKDLQLRFAGTPVLPPRVASRAKQLLNDKAPSKMSLLSRLLRGNTTMKKLTISTTVLAILCAGAMIILPNKAAASSPLEMFKQMRNALSLAANRGELTVTVRAREHGIVDITGTLDGTPLPPSFPLQVVSKQDDDIVTVFVTVDFDPEHYSSIRRGKAPNSLEMVYKELPNSTIHVQLDPNTKLPASWTTEEIFAEVVPPTVFKPKNVPEPSKTTETMMWARIRLRIGQEATVTIGPSRN